VVAVIRRARTFSSGGRSRSEDRKNRTNAVVLALIAGGTSIVVALVTYLGVVHAGGSAAAPPPTAATTTATVTPRAAVPVSTAPSPAACAARVTVDAPVAGQAVTGTAGVEVSGTACGLDGSSVWVFDHADGDSTYDDVNENEPGPITDQDGTWSVLDQPIGDTTDVNQPYFLTVVLASPDCTATLLHTPLQDDLLTIPGMPLGCQVIADIKVVVTT
jgi:hypothetical protein